jgi:hypothetical protein
MGLHKKRILKDGITFNTKHQNFVGLNRLDLNGILSLTYMNNMQVSLLVNNFECYIGN